LVRTVLFLRSLDSLWHKNNHPLAACTERIDKYFRGTLRSGTSTGLPATSAYHLFMKSVVHPATATLSTCFTLTSWLTLRPWTCRWHFPSKCQLPFNRLYGIISHKTWIFMKKVDSAKRAGSRIWEKKILQIYWYSKETVSLEIQVWQKQWQFFDSENNALKEETCRCRRHDISG
jgi:hypothetical protein